MKEPDFFTKSKEVRTAELYEAYITLRDYTLKLRQYLFECETLNENDRNKIFVEILTNQDWMKNQEGKWLIQFESEIAVKHMLEQYKNDINRWKL